MKRSFSVLNFFFLTFLSALFFLFSSFTTIENKASLKILNPALKDIKTLKIELKNQLKVLIIFDPETKVSACALALNTGSWDDPAKYPGMAHFVEHMLFHGSKAYPESDGFAHFLSSHHGDRNGYTSYLETVYYFSLPTTSIEEALSRFSRFFIDPLFDPAATSKELYAVDEEYKLHLINDNYRIFQVEKELTSSTHPHHLFNIGSKEILSSIPRKDLIDWYQSHYSANQMTLVFYTNLSLDQASSLINQNFSPIENRHIKRIPITEPFLSDRQIGKVVYIEPLKELKKFVVQWEVDPKFTKDDSSLKFLSYLLNRSSSHSLLTILKKQNLIENCSFGQQILGKEHALFAADFDLTDHGLNNLDLILAYLQNAFLTIQQNPPDQKLFNEMNETAALEYTYQSRLKPSEEVVQYASLLLKEPLSTFPDQAFLASTYSKTELKEILSKLTVEKGFFEVIAKNEKTKIKSTTEEQWTQSKYSIATLPQTWIKTTTVAVTEKLPDPTFQLPAVNPFMPANLTLLPIKQTTPLKVVNNSSAEVYFQQSEKIKEPKINYTLNFSSPQIDGSKLSVALVDLFLIHFQRATNELIKEASLGGLDFEIYHRNLKLTLILSGFSSKAPLFLTQLLEQLKNPILTSDEFLEYKQDLLELYANHQKNISLEQALEEVPYLLIEKGRYPSTLLEKEASLITYENYQAFVKGLFQKNFLEGSFVGNLNQAEAQNWTAKTQEILAFQPAPKPELLALVLPSTPSVIYKSTNQNGSALVLIIDQNPFSYRKRALQKLANPILNEAFFHTLRSEEKVGYIAHTQDLEIKDHLYTLFFLQSDGFTGETLLQKSEVFLTNFTKSLKQKIPLSRFETLKKDLLVALKESPQNLDSLAVKLNRSAFLYQDLDYYDQIISVLEEVSYDEFLAFIQNSFSQENLKKTAIIVQKEKPSKLIPPYAFTTVQALKQQALLLSASRSKTSSRLNSGSKKQVPAQKKQPLNSPEKMQTLKN